MSSNSGSDGSGESFLSRWSRRKRADERDPSERSAEEIKPADGGSSTKVEGAPPVEKVDLSALPKIDDLLPSSDISAFLKKGVPEELRRLALRKAWSLDPQIRDFIEVAENQYDWNKPNGVPGFGPLDPGTDIETLLKQATGQLKELDKQVETITSENASPDRSLAEQPSEVANSDGRDAVSAAMVQVDGMEPSSTAKLNSRTAADGDSKQASKSSTLIRRRHGGALPT